MNKQAIARMDFIDMLNEEFLSNTGYGAYAHLSTFDGVNLFDRFIEQPATASMYIKSYVKKFIK